MTYRTEIGRIIRLQVQLSSLKVGPPKGRYFDPAPLHEADRLDLNHDGVTAVIDGRATIDVHNATHPASKNRDGINGISVGFTSHYELIRERFGGRMVNGIAGENILVETDAVVTLDQIRSGLLIEGDDGRRIALVDVSVAHPCVEFSRFAMDDSAAPPLAVSETLRFLGNGIRGFYAAFASLQPLRVEPGDRLFAVRDGS